ncbi:MAG: hypothetical protein Q9227_002291 [Pyrenula ochraceoflavens]
MSVERFETRFPVLLIWYCLDLKTDACNDLEKSTVRFMNLRSRRLWITRRVCEAFGPEDHRAAKFAELQKQREERYPLLEQFLRGDQYLNKDVEGSFDDSDDNSEFGAGYDFSNLRLVKDFLLGKALTNLQIKLRYFVNAEKNKGRSASSGGVRTRDEEVVRPGTPLSNRSIGEMNPAKPKASKGSKPQGVQKCGERFQEDIVESYPGHGDALVEQCTLDADDCDIEKQGASTEIAGTQSSSSIYPTSGVSSPRQSATSANQPRLEVTASGKKRASQETSEQGRWVLLCLPGRRYYEVHNTCVKKARCNRDMYAQLHKRYHLKFRRWILWLTLRKLESVSFVRFHIFWRNNVNIEAIDLGSLPPPTSTDYDFDRMADRPPILRTALTHFLQHPMHAPRGTRHLARMPKKMGDKVAIAEESDEEREGWGLYVREVVCWKRTSIAFGFLGVAALVFAIVWCRLHDGDIQDGFTVTGVLLAYGTIFLGLIQAAIFQQSAKFS